MAIFYDRVETLYREINQLEKKILLEKSEVRKKLYFWELEKKNIEIEKLLAKKTP